MSRPVFASLYQHWVWIGVPAMAVAAAALVWLIAGVVRTVRSAHLFRTPLAERQKVRFAEAGRVVLSMEGPRGSPRFADVNFELRSAEGEPVEGRPAWMRARTSGVSAARVELLAFDIPRPGRYVLSMTGLGPPREGDARHAVVFARPHLSRTLVYVAGIVLASGVLIASLVLFLLRLREPQPLP